MASRHEPKDDHSVGNREDNESNRDNDIESSSNMRTFHFGLIDLIDWEIEQPKTDNHEAKNNQSGLYSYFSLCDRRFSHIFPNYLLRFHNFISKKMEFSCILLEKFANMKNKFTAFSYFQFLVCFLFVDN